jgi:hypothetical protein
MAKVRLEDIERVQFLEYTPDELKLIGPLGGRGIALWEGGCSWRKAHIHVRATRERGARTINNVFIDVNYTGNLKGPDGEQYNLAQYSIKQMIR